MYTVPAPQKVPMTSGDSLRYLATRQWQRGVFGARLRLLFESVLDFDGMPFTSGEIAARSTRMGFPISAAEIGGLRCGRYEAPTFRTVEGIARAFDIDICFFLEREPAQNIPASVELRDPRVASMVRSLSDLSEQALATLIAAIDRRKDL